jgi:hypothetical protein
MIVHHMEKGFISLQDLTFEIQNENPNNIGVHRAPGLRFAIFEVAIKPRILERTIGDAYFWMDCRRGAVISAAR